VFLSFVWHMPVSALLDTPVKGALSEEKLAV
jgi:hypothetical protein